MLVKPPMALALGRLHPNKGFALLLAALAKTREVRLAIAGDGPLRGPLERLAADLGIAERVSFLGWREDVPELLANADLLVCPSLHEPLGNVVIEAWSAGLPVVATASDGPAALIEDESVGFWCRFRISRAAVLRHWPRRSSASSPTLGCAPGSGKPAAALTRPSLPRRSSSPAIAAFSTGWRPDVRHRRPDDP